MSAWPVFFAAASALARSPLLLHQPAEARPRRRQALLGGHLQGEVDREAVGVVEQERLVAGRAWPPAALVSSTAASKIVVPVRSVPRKAASSASMTVSMRGASVIELRVLLAHRLDRDGGELVHVALVAGAEQAHVADRAAHDAAQHVAAALVAGHDAVADEHHARCATWSATTRRRHVGARGRGRSAVRSARPPCRGSCQVVSIS